MSPRLASAVAAQVAAADPRRSTWVSANAGSGKTRVLTDRVARLLLDGAQPHRILCLTYTNAAAAEMQNRLFGRLGEWAMLADAPLRAALADLGEPALSAEALARSRTLFARALDTPGGLKIQTIHGFCQALLRRFPTEAGVWPGFALLDERSARQMQAAALDRLASGPGREALDGLLAQEVVDPARLVPQIIRDQARWAAPLDVAATARALGADPQADAAALLGRVLAGLDDSLIDRIAAAIAQGTQTERKCAAALAALRGAPAHTALEMLRAALLTQSGTPLKRGLPGAATKKAHPDLSDWIEQMKARAAQAQDVLRANIALARAQVLHDFARAFLAEYAQAKTATGQLDFDDLIERSRALLTNPDFGPWVLYRLDGGIDHILVDEAQDTSPAQWQIIEALSAEMLAGQGARGPGRTLFVVGDEKQSIYSFQGADPDAFRAMRARLDGQLVASSGGNGAALAEGALTHSFRSAPVILSFVDQVFAGPAGAGFVLPSAHQAIAPDRPGRIEIWPFRAQADKPPPRPWEQPVDTPSPDDPVRALAQDIADTIAGHIAASSPLPDSDSANGTRPVRARDFLVLVQRRGRLFFDIIAALQNRGVPVAGADRLRINSQLAARDLLAALAFAVAPYDDLSLAAVLRSPLVGLTEAELFALAHGRTGTLWPQVQARAPQPMLADLLSQADFLRPYELLELILLRHDGRRRLVARLGPETADVIDVLLALALEYERTEPPSLTGFLGWITADDPEVKRQVDQASDQVRVMTVHGAKGLEAPVVILPDTADHKAPAGTNGPVTLTQGGPAWQMPAPQRPAALADLASRTRDKAHAEDMRKLYVALTRPQSWLIVAGAGTRKQRDDEDAEAAGEGGGDPPATACWHDLISDAAASASAQATPEGGWLITSGWPAPSVASAPATRPDTPPAPAPAAAPAPIRAPQMPRPLSPSDLGGSHALPGEPLADGLDHGARVHRLLEHLPHLATPAAWPAPTVLHDMARRLLPGASAPALARALSEAVAVLRAPDLAPLFGPDALHEVALAATLPGLGQMRGRIDLLLPGPDRILAVDFKSNALIPTAPEQVPEAFLRQMAAYHDALTQVWPGRPVQMALLWTAAPALMPLPLGLLAPALARAAADPDVRARAGLPLDASPVAS